jgi:rhomboid family GlyGly-CTERM serine protease
MPAQAIAGAAPPASRSARSQPTDSGRNWPLATVLALVAMSLLVQCSPAAQAALEFNRAAIAAGQWWRLLTGNFVHYGWLHLAANVGAFAVLGWLAVGRASRAVWVVPLSAVAVGLGIQLWAGGTATYRGVSGVDCALLAWLLVTTAFQDGGWKAVAWLGALLLVAAKSVYEAVTGQVLLPTSAPPGVEVVNITHVVGLGIGALAAVIAPPARQAGNGH